MLGDFDPASYAFTSLARTQNANSVNGVLGDVDDFVLEEFLSTLDPRQPPRGCGADFDTLMRGDGSVSEHDTRKRLREANLQAQRRCRQRGKNHVAALEAEVEELRAELFAAKADNSRMQASLHDAVLGLDRCNQRSAEFQSTSEQEKQRIQAQLEDTIDGLRTCAIKSAELQKALKAEKITAAARAAANAAANISDGTLFANGDDGDVACSPCGMIQERIVDALTFTPYSTSVIKRELEQPLHLDAALVVEAATAHPALPPDVQDSIFKVVVRLVDYFREHIAEVLSSCEKSKIVAYPIPCIYIFVLCMCVFLFMYVFIYFCRVRT